MSRLLHVFLLSAAAAVPGAAIAGVQIAVHCADLPEGKAGGPSADIAWFEVYLTGEQMQAGPDARKQGHFTASELNGARATCRVDGHEYAFGLSDYVVKDAKWMSVDYRAGLWIDGHKVWPEPGEGQADGFIGTVRVNYRTAEICSSVQHSSGHGGGAFGQPRPRSPTLHLSAQTGANQTCYVYEMTFP